MKYTDLQSLYNDPDAYKTDTSLSIQKSEVKKDVFDDFFELDTEIIEPVSFLQEPTSKDSKAEYLKFEEKKAVLTSMFNELEDGMNETKKLDLTGLNDIEDTIIPVIDKIYDGKKEPKTKKLLPWSVVDSHHLQAAFVDCVILGFITAGIGAAMLIYILNHI